ncbi:MAG: radical SAM protein [Candidatus Lokiarchaeota archaeon]|nr:radical SAM protein [Candidatus Lokiarchaeota archaeon]
MKQYLQLSSNKILDILKIIPGNFILPSVQIFPSNLCNFDCVMCSSGKSKIEDIEVMDFSLMEKIIIECSKFIFKPLLHFSGYGEPLLYPRIKETMELCDERKNKWSMTTNAYMLEKYVEDVVSNNCYAINISIHGNAAQHDKITGIKGSFDKVIKSILKLEEVKQQYNKITPYIALNCVITNINVTHLKDILKLLQSLPVSSITFQHLHFSINNLRMENESGMHLQTIDKANLHELNEFLTYLEHANLPIKTFTYPKIKRKDIIGYYSDPFYKFNNSCIYPWLSVEIYPNGNVQLCNQVIGNLETDSLKSIIKSKKANEFKNWVKQEKTDPFSQSPDCFRCMHQRYYK